MPPLTKTINLAVVGVGLVGSEFIRQTLHLSQSHPVRNTLIRIISVSSSKKSLTLSPGETRSIGADWKKQLDESSTPASISGLLNELKTHPKGGLQRIVLVDNTSSGDVAAAYPGFLNAGISVVTPNKKAFSGELGLWEDIVSAEEEGGAKVLNESTVGAGLPVIAPLREMIATGDEITKIEGVFSGTLSYIFNEYSPVSSQDALPEFSTIVNTARKNGYTEPNPADDLSGSDVARKLAILSRLIPSLTSHLPRGFEDVSTKSLVPQALQGFAGDGAEFVSALNTYDAEFDKLRAEANEEGKVLRYVGAIDVESGVVKASLERYPKTHPFAASLKGSDNIVLIYSKRYGANPLIIQGAGAGAAVTAMGVLGDVLKLAL